MSRAAWHLVAGEYPPEAGGVADYTAILARALAGTGSEVHVWCPGNAVRPEVEANGVVVHRVGGRFGPGDLFRLDRALDRAPGPRTVLVQYTPHSFGCRAMNLPFAAWAASRWFRRRDDVRVMFHEVAYPWVRRPLRHNLIAAVNRLMAAVLLRGCARAYVSIPAWMLMLRRLGAGRRPIIWTPVPASVPTDPNPARVSARRAGLGGGHVIGHFGTYGPLVTGLLGPALRALLKRRADVRVLLLGAGSDRWRGELTGDWPDRVRATGPLPAVEVAEYLRACDLVIQPYPDGASTRRTSLMAALANGVPVVTTVGALSEPVWSGGAVAAVPVGDPERLADRALELLGQPGRLVELGAAGRRLYEDRFAIGWTVVALLAPEGTGGDRSGLASSRGRRA
jgi:glycosyltransferase involved in cell wall biosynthesis